MIKLGITYVWALNMIMILEIEGCCCGVNAAPGSGVSGWSSRSLVWDWWILDPSIRAALLQLFVEMSGFVHQTDCSWSWNRTRFG